MCVQRTLRRVRERFHRFTPNGLLQGYRPVTLREREQRQRDARGDRINTGVSVFTRVNMLKTQRLSGK